MAGLGTLINTGLIIAGGLMGLLFGRYLKESQQLTMTHVCGISAMFIGIAGAMSGMLAIESGSIVSVKTMLVIMSLVAGAVLGELIDAEGKLERFGEWLKRKSGNSGDRKFVEGFVNASLTVCVGAMAVVGAIKDGIDHDYSVLVAKGILDCIILVVMTSSMGKGCMFSAIPVLLFEGSITLLAGALAPVLTEAAIANISLIGSILIFCVGVNLLWERKLKVANMLPALIIAVIIEYIPALSQL